MRALVAAAAAVVALVLLGTSGRAAAQMCGGDEPPEGSSESVQFDGLAPGDTRQWPMTVTNTHDDPAAMHLSLTRSGALASALLVGLEGCAEAWAPPTTDDPAVCPTGATVLLSPTTTGEIELDLANLAVGGTWYAMFSAQLPGSAGNGLQGSTGTVRTLVVWNDDCPPTTTTAPPTTPPPSTAAPTTAAPTSAAPTSGVTRISVTDAPIGRNVPDRLPFTGTQVATLVLLAGVLVVTGGLVLAGAARRR